MVPYESGNISGTFETSGDGAGGGGGSLKGGAVTENMWTSKRSSITINRQHEHNRLYNFYAISYIHTYIYIYILGVYVYVHRYIHIYIYTHMYTRAAETKLMHLRALSGKNKE